MAGVPSLGIDRYSYSGEQAAIYVLTGPGQFSEYVMTVPEPGSMALLAAAGFGFLAWRLRKVR